MDAIPTEGLDDTERTTHSMLGTLLDEAAAAIDLRVQEMACDAFFGGAQAVLVMTLPKTLLRDRQAAEDYLQRLELVPGMLEAWADRLRAGSTNGRTATGMGVAAAIAQCRALAAVPATDHPFLLPFTSPVAVEAELPSDAVERAAALVAGPIASALDRHADVLEGEILPTARPDEAIGLCHLDDGAALYAAALAQHTTTTLKAGEIHQIGLDVIAELDQEYAEIGQRPFGTTDRAEIFQRLRSDASLRYDDPAEAVTQAQACVVRPIPEVASKGGASSRIERASRFEGSSR